MDLTFTTDLPLGGFLWSTGAGYPYVPTVTELDVAWDAERALQAPNPARVTMRAWLPDSSRTSHLPAVGQPVRVTVTDLADDTNPDRRVHVFAGRVDKVVRSRRRGRSSTPATRLDLLSGPYRSTTWLQNGVPVMAASTEFDLSLYPDAPAVLVFQAPVNDPGSEVFLDDTNPLRGVLPLAARVQPDTWLWATDHAPEPSAPPFAPNPESELPPGPNRGSSRFWWRVNGTYRPVADGPLVIGASVPSDLALVTQLMPGQSARISTPVWRPRAAAVGKLPPGEWLTITASCEKATAARHKIGDEPWPVETVWDRLGRIAGAASRRGVPVPFDRSWFLDTSWHLDAQSTYVDARDVDNVSALELWDDALQAIGAASLGLPGYIVATRPVEQPNVLTSTGHVDTNQRAVQLPPQLVPEGDLEVSSTALTNRVRIGYRDIRDPDPDNHAERTVELTDAASLSRWGESAARWSTAVVHRAGDPEDPRLGALSVLTDRLQNALSGLAEPSYTFAEPVTLTTALLERMPDVTPTGTRFLRLLDMATRHGALVSIPHAVPHVPTVFTLRGGSLVRSENGQTVVTLQLEPAGQSGAPSLLLAMSPATSSLTFAQLEAASNLTFTESRAVAPE